MRIRTLIAVLTMAAVFAVARPASAQDKGAVNLGVSYTNLTTWAGGAHQTDPLGWLASVGAGVSKSMAIVGEVGGNYKKETILGVSIWEKQHSFQGGLRWHSSKGSKMTPFLQVVTGVTHFTGSNAWTLTPGGGVDTKIGKKVDVRLQGDWMYMRDSGVNANGLRLGAGIVIGLSKK